MYSIIGLTGDIIVVSFRIRSVYSLVNSPLQKLEEDQIELIKPVVLETDSHIENSGYFREIISSKKLNKTC